MYYTLVYILHYPIWDICELYCTIWQSILIYISKYCPYLSNTTHYLIIPTCTTYYLQTSSYTFLECHKVYVIHDICNFLSLSNSNLYLHAIPYKSYNFLYLLTLNYTVLWLYPALQITTKITFYISFTLYSTKSLNITLYHRLE